MTDSSGVSIYNIFIDGGDIVMMGHGKHDNCMMCRMGKAIGMIEKCTDKNCTDPSHKKEKNESREHEHDHN